MSAPISLTPYIDKDSLGRPLITDTTTKVHELIAEKIAYGWDAEEIYLQHNYLTLSQVHSALAYYYDHMEEIERLIEGDVKYAEDFFAKQEASPIRSKVNIYRFN